MKKNNQGRKKDVKSGHVILKLREHSFAEDHKDLIFSSKGAFTHQGSDQNKSLSQNPFTPSNKLMLPNVFTAKNNHDGLESGSDHHSPQRI